MSKKIIFFDADGTIMKGHEMTKKTKEAFKLLRENGHILVLSTGRALPSIDGPLGDMKFENIVCSAGGTVVINNEIVYKNPMAKESQKEILEFLDRHNVVYNMEANDAIYTRPGNTEKILRLFEVPERGTIPDEEHDVLTKRYSNVRRRTKEIDDASNIDINKIFYLLSDRLYDDKIIPITSEDVTNELGSKYQCISLSLSKLFAGGEISEIGVSKKTGMRVVLDYFNIKSEDIYAIGDDFNDIEMLDFATTSIVMGHAHEEVKKYANYITKDIDNDGFYHAMKHFELI